MKHLPYESYRNVSFLPTPQKDHCPRCGGMGYLSKELCHYCNGTGITGGNELAVDLNQPPPTS
jgi:DnaJ-class molecular chaperone